MTYAEVFTGAFLLGLFVGVCAGWETCLLWLLIAARRRRRKAGTTAIVKQ